jgi:hypothetical protein
MRRNGTFSFLQVKRNRPTGVTEEQINEIIGWHADHGDQSVRAVHDGCRRVAKCVTNGHQSKPGNAVGGRMIRRDEGGDGLFVRLMPIEAAKCVTHHIARKRAIRSGVSFLPRQRENAAL